MTDKIVEGIWDCPYCNATAIGGLTKHCPNCGHPQDKGTKFRVGEKRHYLNDEEISKVGNKPDWLCDYCNSLNNAKFVYCTNCGASREKENKNYFDLRKEEQENSKKKRTNISLSETSPKANTSSKMKTQLNTDLSLECINTTSESDFNYAEACNTKIDYLSGFIFTKIKSLKYVLGILTVMFLLLGTLVGAINLFTPHEYIGTIDSKLWSRSIEIEKYKTFEESDWTLPTDGRLQYTRQEIRSYEKVLDHYEQKSKQVPYQVQDGYDVTYSDNGNGTFTEHKTPKYKTEYKTEYYEEPVYRDEPVYDTKYYYEIDRWVYERSVKTSGFANEPYWGEVVLADKEREGNRKEKYKVKIKVLLKKKAKEKIYSYSPDLAEWKQYEKQQTVKITVVAGIVTKVEYYKD